MRLQYQVSKKKIFLPIMIVQGIVYLSAQRIDFVLPLCLFTRGRFHLWYFYLSDELKKIVELIYKDKGTQWWNRKMFHAIQNSNQNLYFQKYSSHYGKKKRMAFFTWNFHKNIFSQSIIFWQVSGKYCHLNINQASFKITNLHLGFVSGCHQPTGLHLAINPGQFLSC